MPALFCNPSRAARGEAQYRDCCGRAAKDTVGAAEVVVEIRFGDIPCGRVAFSRVPNALQREASKCLSTVAPGVEVPVVAVVSESLRRDFAVGYFTCAARFIGDAQARAIEQRFGGVGEPLPGTTTGDAQDAYAADNLPRAELFEREDALDAIA